MNKIYVVSLKHSKKEYTTYPCPCKNVQTFIRQNGVKAFEHVGGVWRTTKQFTLDFHGEKVEIPQGSEIWEREPPKETLTTVRHTYTALYALWANIADNSRNTSVVLNTSSGYVVHIANELMQNLPSNTDEFAAFFQSFSTNLRDLLSNYESHTEAIREKARYTCSMLAGVSNRPKSNKSFLDFDHVNTAKMAELLKMTAPLILDTWPKDYSEKDNSFFVTSCWKTLEDIIDHPDEKIPDTRLPAATDNEAIFPSYHTLRHLAKAAKGLKNIKGDITKLKQFVLLALIEASKTYTTLEMAFTITHKAQHPGMVHAIKSNPDLFDGNTKIITSLLALAQNGKLPMLKEMIAAGKEMLTMLAKDTLSLSGIEREALESLGVTLEGPVYKSVLRFCGMPEFFREYHSGKGGQFNTVPAITLGRDSVTICVCHNDFSAPSPNNLVTYTEKERLKQKVHVSRFSLTNLFGENSATTLWAELMNGWRRPSSHASNCGTEAVDSIDGADLFSTPQVQPPQA